MMTVLVQLSSPQVRGLYRAPRAPPLLHRGPRPAHLQSLGVRI